MAAGKTIEKLFFSQKLFCWLQPFYVHHFFVNIFRSFFYDEVIPERGLCVCVSKIDSVGDPLTFPDTCGTYAAVTFRLIMFKPYDGEIIEGRVLAQDQSGILSRLFFHQTKTEKRF